jgi:uncharacterized membrane protein/thiol-disulfide isomerase/thioredoxin
VRIRAFKILVLAVMIACLGAIATVYFASSKSPSVNAVLFHSPSCPHCQKVISEDLPPLLDKYGEKLNIVGINVNTPQGQQLYQAAVQRFNIPDERIGVPCLIVGNTILVGSLEIPEQFPGIIDQGLASGGIDWPDIPGLTEVIPLEEQNAAENSSLDANTTDGREILSTNQGQLSILEKFTQDKTGNTLALVVLIGMIASVFGSGYTFVNGVKAKKSPSPDWTIPLLAVVGLGIAVYLSYVELTQTQAVCGPIGDCNLVQQSPYAYLLGIIPIGVLGAVGYVLILFTWVLQKFSSSKWQNTLRLAIWGLAWIGILFSIYLTFLEPFIIGATCAWCITSAIVITLILWAATAPAKKAWESGYSHESVGRRNRSKLSRR